MGSARLGRHEDVVQARLEFADGAVANLCASRVSHAAQPKRKMRIWSDDALAAIDFGNRTAQIVRPSLGVREGTFDYNELSADEKLAFKERLFRDILPLESLEIESRNALADELRDFVDSIRTARAPRVDARAGRDAVAVAEAVLDSLRTHRRAAAGSELSAPRIDTPLPNILRPPHWQPQVPTPRPAHREAG